LTGLLKPLKYHIFGADVKTTASPIMHTVAFRKLGLPHSYHISEASDIQSYEAILNDPTFGGASIARPFKVEIGLRLRRLSKHAQAIGAVNTITATPTGPVGDNTDWKGIRTCISRALTPENVINANTTALVIGAGGVARAAIYALNHLGVSKIALVNRTMKAAHALASDMSRLDPGLYIHVLESIESKVIKSLGLQPRIIVYAIPIPEQDDRDATRTRPHQDLLQIPGGGVLLDMTFQGDLALSPMLKLSKGIMNDAWVFVPGIEVLLEQGYEQIRLWTGRRPPRTDMRSAVMREYTGNNLYQGTLRSI
jgi:shikimate-5-dehydrogenase